jgi:hypothetical protein
MTGSSAWTAEVHPDAAGGLLDGIGWNVGGVCGDRQFYLSWSGKINCGVKAADGKKLSKKLSAPKLVGPLATVCASPKLNSLGPMRIWKDNAESIWT